MAVRQDNDLVSKTLLEQGYWEVEDPAIWGQSGQALDIGGNIGYYTFALANAGWTVNTFEPMQRNLVFLEATLCENPQLAERINLHKFGLGMESQICRMVTSGDNVGNGLVRCTDADVHDAEWEEKNFQKAGEFQMRRLDDVLKEESISKVDFVKLDVEGYECQVLKGAGDFLKTLKPRLIKSEVWKEMVRCDSLEYFRMFENTGYRFGMDEDPGCTEKRWTEDPDWANTTKFWAAGANFYMCKAD